MNIPVINLKNVKDQEKTSSVNIQSNKTSAYDVQQLFKNTTVSSVEKTDTANNYNKALLTENSGEDIIEQLKESAATNKDSLKALFNKMSGADGVAMDEDGYNLNDMEPKEMVTVVDRIKIMLAAYCKDFSQTEGIDENKIKQVLGNNSFSNEVASKLKKANLPDTKDNIEQVKSALSQSVELKELSEDSKNYLVKNRLEPTIQNIYKAQHLTDSSNLQKRSDKKNTDSGEKKTRTIEKEEWKQLKGQVNDILAKAGLSADNHNIDNAKGFIQDGIPVTAQNLAYKSTLDKLDLSDIKSIDRQGDTVDRIIENMSLGNRAETTLLTEQKSNEQKMADAIETIGNVDIAETVCVTEQNQEFTIQNLRAAGEFLQNGIPVESQTQNQQIDSDTREAKVLHNYIKLQEMRILMTAQAGVSLVKQGFDLDTTPIAKLVEELKKQEIQLYGNQSEQMFEVKKAVTDIKNYPDIVIGSVLKMKAAGEKITISDFSHMGSNLKQKFRHAGQTYEAVGTQIRRDLGDSFNKAADASTQSLLEEMGIESSVQNQDAVRILAYNKMDITKDNIDQVKGLYSTLKNMINNMRPDTVYGMIKDNINPMKTDINDLNEYLVQQNEKSDVEDKFSRFLYKLERTKGISKEQREQFIGIYKMMNIFKRDAGKAVGALLKQNANITMSNLMAAYQSRKSAGIDQSIDETKGMSEISGTVNYYHNLFSMSASYITPKTLKSVDEEKNINQRSVENFCQAVTDHYDHNGEAVYFEDYLNSIKNVSEAEDKVIKMLTNNDLQVSVNQIMAAQNVMSQNYFQQFFGNKNILNNNEKAYKDKVVKGVDKNTDIQEIFEGFIGSVESESDLDTQYSKLHQKVKEDIESTLQSEDTPTYEDINDLRMRGKEIDLISTLSKRHKYTIPYIKHDGIGTINLQIMEGEDSDKGKIVVRLETDELGKVSVEAKLDGQTAGVFGITTGDEKILSEKLERIKNQIKEELKIDDVNVYSGRSRSLPEIEYNTKNHPVSLKNLYTLSKTIIKGLIQESA